MPQQAVYTYCTSEADSSKHLEVSASLSFCLLSRYVKSSRTTSQTTTRVSVLHVLLLAVYFSFNPLCASTLNVSVLKRCRIFLLTSCQDLFLLSLSGFKDIICSIFCGKSVNCKLKSNLFQSSLVIRMQWHLLSFAFFILANSSWQQVKVTSRLLSFTHS